VIWASVVIPTKNPGPVFRQVLHSVLDQQVGFDYEVLVIDSGSTDGTLDYLSELGDPRLRIHHIDPRSFGHGRTRNLGLSLTSGKYAVLITHDATPASNRWLSAMVAAADADPEVAGVFGRHIAYPHANPFTSHELELHFESLNHNHVMYIDNQERYARDVGYRRLLHFFSNNNALIRRSVWEVIPFPDVDFAEDQIWAQKIIEAGYKKAYARDAVVLHSHNYRLFERLQRSFDEAYAFRRLFGYVQCGSLGSLVRSWIRLTARDLAFARIAGLWQSQTSTVLKMPFDNFMRLAGQYLGSRGELLPNSLHRTLSRDKQFYA
jgi:rhamnosyltransferase